MLIKGNAEFVQKVTFEPLIDLKQNHYQKWEKLGVVLAEKNVTLP